MCEIKSDYIAGVEFVKEMLYDDLADVSYCTFLHHPKDGTLVFEWIPCKDDETPYMNYPNSKWEEYKGKIMPIWTKAKDLNAKLYLVNFAPSGTSAADQILLTQIIDMDDSGVKQEQNKRHTRESFKEWYKDLNDKCINNTAAESPGSSNASSESESNTDDGSTYDSRDSRIGSFSEIFGDNLDPNSYSTNYDIPSDDLSGDDDYDDSHDAHADRDLFDPDKSEYFYRGKKILWRDFDDTFDDWDGRWTNGERYFDTNKEIEDYIKSIESNSSPNGTPDNNNDHSRLKEPTVQHALITDYKCPNCGGDIKNGQYGYYCANEQCHMNIGKFYRTPLSEKQLHRLLGGGEIKIKVNDREQIIGGGCVKSNITAKNGITYFNWKSRNIPK